MGASKKQKPAGKSKTPKFDEAALERLTAKIDQTLPQDQKELEQPANPKRKEHKRNGLKTKRSEDQDAAQGPSAKKRKSNANESGKMSKTALLEEIRLLGGDEADLELVADIDSDAEEGAPKAKAGGEAPLDNAFKNELAKFALSLGFEQVPQGDDADTEASEDDASDSNGEEDEREVRNKKEVEAPRQEELGKVRGKNSGKLVSKTVTTQLPSRGRLRADNFT